MKNLLALVMMLFSIVACNSSQQTSLEEDKTTTENATVDKTPKTKQVEKLPATDASKKFGIDFEENLLYSGSYQYYEVDGKEVLHGKMKLASKEEMEAYVARIIAEKGEPAEDDFSIMHSYASASIEGQYVDGVKDGSFVKDATYYEGAGLSKISFDAASNSCTFASYDGVGEGFCFKYEGPLKDCTFAAITTMTEEIECE